MHHHSIRRQNKLNLRYQQGHLLIFLFDMSIKLLQIQGNQSWITQTLLLYSQKKILQSVLHHALQLRISRHCTQFTCVIIG